MRSGKDTCVDYLITKYGGEKISFSKPLYDILHYAQSICNFPIEKDREFLQWIGTDWARQKNPNVWIDLALKNIENDKNIYSSDVRFLNEFEALKENGFIIVKIEREYVNKESISVKSHVSENDLNNIEDSRWDYIIDNNGTLEELYKKIDNIVFEILN